MFIPTVSSGWFRAWRSNVINMRKFPSEEEGYSYAASLALMMYVTWEALERGRVG